MKISAFRGLRPTENSVEKVVCPPYDVVNESEARQIADGNNGEFMKVIRAEVNFPISDDIDQYSEKVYQKSLEKFNELKCEDDLDNSKDINNGHLIREKDKCFYLYSQQMGDHVQHGVVGLCHVDDYLDNVIKKHEVTRKDKESDRIKLTETLEANTGPVFLTYRKDDEVENLLKQVKNSEPLFDYEYISKFSGDEMAVKHKVWKIDAGSGLVEAFNNVESSYIADGHHRSASAAKVAMKFRKKSQASGDYTGEEDFNWFLCVLFPHDELNILPYNRVVKFTKKLKELSDNDILDKLSKIGNFEKCTNLEPQKAGEVCIYFRGNNYKIDFGMGSTYNESQLDVDLLQDNILRPIFDIKDQRTSKDIDFIGGIRGTQELVNIVDSGRADIAFSMYPVQIEQIMNISDKGDIMPAKSTWFEPKLLSGFFIHTFKNNS